MIHITLIISLVSTIFIIAAIISLFALKKLLRWAPAAVALTQLALVIAEVLTNRPFGHTMINFMLWSCMWNLDRRINQYKLNGKTSRVPKSTISG